MQKNCLLGYFQRLWAVIVHTFEVLAWPWETHLQTLYMELRHHAIQLSSHAGGEVTHSATSLRLSEILFACLQVWLFWTFPERASSRRGPVSLSPRATVQTSKHETGSWTFRYQPPTSRRDGAESEHAGDQGRLLGRPGPKNYLK